MLNIFTVKSATAIVGGLSSPNKMPCFSYSIPAQKCLTGNKLRDVVGSVCSKCYALKGFYGFPVVKEALFRRFAQLAHPQWVAAMVYLITRKEKSGYFRFHDAGDLQSVEHLKNIVSVCVGTPSIKFWLPTREFSIIADYLKAGFVFPENLIIRLSSYMLDGPAPTTLATRLGCLTSGVSKTGYTCPAPKQGNVCGACRACWDKNVASVNYKQH